MINRSLYFKVDSYPFADRVNPYLCDIFKEYYIQSVKGGAKRTTPNLHEKGIKEIDNILRWICDLLPDFAYNISGGRIIYDAPKFGGTGGFDPYSYKVDGCWGITYDKGDSVIKHNHFPYTFSFCYYVNTPPQSPPLIIEGKRMRMKEGQLIIFLSHYNHWVPTSKVDGRCVIAGNIKHGGTHKVSL